MKVCKKISSKGKTYSHCKNMRNSQSSKSTKRTKTMKHEKKNESQKNNEIKEAHGRNKHDQQRNKVCREKDEEAKEKRLNQQMNPWSSFGTTILPETYEHMYEEK